MLRLLSLLFLFTYNSAAGQLYQFDVKDPSTYTYDCGTTTGAYWGVKGDSCALTTTATTISSACQSSGNITLPVNVKINQTGQLSCSDTAWIHYTINGGTTWIPLDTIVGCEQTANTSYWYYPEIPNNSTFQLRVTFDNGAPNDWWQIKDGDIVINDPCFLLPLGWVSLEGRAALLDNVLTIGFEYAHDEVDSIVIERSKDGIAFEPIDVELTTLHTNSTFYEARDRQPYLTTSYYRALVVHEDGTPSKSDIIAINRLFNGMNDILSFFPNPTVDYVFFQPLPNNVRQATIRIVDVMGRQLFELQWEWGEQWLGRISVADWPAGEYVVQLITNGRTEQRKLIIPG